MEKLMISLAAARVNARMTQAEVAKAIKISKNTLINWEKDIGCYRRLAEFGAKEEDFDKLVESTFAQTRVMGHSSWKLTADELKEIYKKAL